MDAASMALAGAVRRLRAEHQWTLDHAAARLGISRRLLVQIEAGEANPSLSTLLAIASGLGVHLNDLLSGDRASSPLVVQDDTSSAPVVWSSPAGSTARLLVGRGPLELWAWTLAPGDRRASDAHYPDSMEALHVQKGTIELELGDDVIQLRPGGSALFSADAPHAYRNTARRPAEFMLTVYDPIH